MEQEMEMLRIRWLNDACYELKLPGGKGILIDPYIQDSRFRLLDREDVEAADYVLISHTHFDHVMDLGYMSKKFNSSLYAGYLSGMKLVSYFDIPGYQMNLCHPGDIFWTEDFKLECYRGRHTKLGDFDRPANWPENLSKEQLDPRSLEMNMTGSYEYLNYLLTLPSGYKVLIWGGGATKDAVRQAENWNPNVTIAQLPRESEEEIARLYAAIGGQIIFLHHHDALLTTGEEGKLRIQKVVEETEKRAHDTRIVCPEKGKWYRIKTLIAMESEEK